MGFRGYWDQVGQTGVDSGTIMITDPCCVVRNNNDTKFTPVQTYDQLLKEYERQEAEAGVDKNHCLPTYQLRNQYGAMVGVVVGNFGGDGVFPVYVQYDETGRIIAAQIRFDGEEPA